MEYEGPWGGRGGGGGMFGEDLWTLPLPTPLAKVRQVFFSTLRTAPTVAQTRN
jgi:hypothetical protein